MVHTKGVLNISFVGSAVQLLKFQSIHENRAHTSFTNYSNKIIFGFSFSSGKFYEFYLSGCILKINVFMCRRGVKRLHHLSINFK